MWCRTPKGRALTPQAETETAPSAHAGVSEALLGPCGGRSSSAAQLVICQAVPAQPLHPKSKQRPAMPYQRVSTPLERAAQAMTPSSRPTSVNAATACRRCASVCAALICTRTRAWPLGTTCQQAHSYL